MRNYAILSLETHLFFLRIMKEHALFLEAGFPCAEREWIRKADWFRRQLESLLGQTVRLSQGMMDRSFLNSEEIITSFTIPAEEATQRLSGIPIDSRISRAEKQLREGCPSEISRERMFRIRRLNDMVLSLLSDFIEFKEAILNRMENCKLYNANYPLLVEHITREARMYRSIVQELVSNKKISREKIGELESFWNRIMMEHAMFIRGLLDPSEEQLIAVADGFAKEYQELLEMAQSKECGAMEHLRRKSLEETRKYKEFKTAGTEGILECQISSIILPLLADHVLREANHYIRLLETRDWEGSYGVMCLSKTRTNTLLRD